MNILCCLDDNYVKHTSVMLTSLLVNNDFECHDIHLITLQLSEENVAYLKNVVSKYNAVFHLHQVDQAMLTGFVRQESDYVSLAAYLRLFSTQVLPVACDKILYIDGDIVVRKSLERLWQLDITGYAVAAIEETIKANCDRHQYDISLGYFNSGVMLIDLKYWREHRVAERAIDYMRQFPERIKSWDQDALNGILKGGLWKRLDLTYNLTTIFLYKPYVDSSDFSAAYAQQYAATVADPCVVHYTGPDKPWDYTLVEHPFKKDYVKYAKILGLKPAFNFGIYVKRSVKRTVKSLFKTVGLRKGV